MTKRVNTLWNNTLHAEKTTLVSFPIFHNAQHVSCLLELSAHMCHEINQLQAFKAATTQKPTSLIHWIKEQPKHQETLIPVNAIMQSPIWYFPHHFKQLYIHHWVCVEGLKMAVHSEKKKTHTRIHNAHKVQNFRVHLHKYSNPWTLVTLVRRGNHGNCKMK